ncbi:hypothetical protein [Orenia marismortui]|uniref:Uncharacterized protein n=1 Tax=Orenia marismortui TaxID=46469 RepID=A0A4R8H8Q8_9FIRM|nr:hypothetical protein [Orenia marismortui]TDX51282.1 hypothetical protein C7959_11430 [Orenia marismortui]
MSEFNKGCMNDNEFEDILEDLSGEFVTVIVKSGGTCDQEYGCGCHSENGNKEEVECCCAWEGLLCSIGSDFIFLIDDGERIFIPVDAIAAIIEDC